MLSNNLKSEKAIKMIFHCSGSLSFLHFRIKDFLSSVFKVEALNGNPCLRNDLFFKVGLPQNIFPSGQMKSDLSNDFFTEVYLFFLFISILP